MAQTLPPAPARPIKIVVLDGFPLRKDGLSWAAFESFGALEFHDRSTPAEVLERSPDATILITNKAPITAEVMDAAPGLRFITVTATGYDCVDVAAARQRGIPVANVPEYGTESVAQFVFALLLELCHHVGQHDQAVRAGDWPRSGDFSFWHTPLTELRGKTMGIVGFGRIGRRVATLANAFGMTVLAHARSLLSAPGGEPFAWSGLDELFARSDVVSLHCPLTPDTAGLVNRERLRLMKPTALLINTSRGGLVVERDLADALEANWLAGAAVDVVSREPIAPDNPLLSAPRCLITPHIAWATMEARRRLLDTTAANVASFLEGRPSNVVN